MFMHAASGGSETTNNCASATYELCVSTAVTVFYCEGQIQLLNP